MVENMSGYTCPHCGNVSHIFGEGGAAKMSHEMNIDILGKAIYYSIGPLRGATNPQALLVGAINYYNY